MTAADDPYRDPDLYDIEYANYDEDVRFYRNVAHRVGGPVLELGCGSGRLTLPLARDGCKIHGVDLSKPMLEQLRRKLEDEPDEVRARVTLTAGDFRALGELGSFPLVLLPFNALHHCMDPEQVLATFGVVQANLRRRGRFVMDCYLPDRELYRRNPDKRYEERIFTHPRTGVRLHSWEQGWYDEEGAIHHVIYAYESPDGHIERTHLKLRMYEMDELADLFDQAGLRVRYQAKDFEGTRPEGQVLKWVLVLDRRP